MVQLQADNKTMEFQETKRDKYCSQEKIGNQKPDTLDGKIGQGDIGTKGQDKDLNTEGVIIYRIQVRTNRVRKNGQMEEMKSKT